MNELRQNTAITVIVGPFLDETDGKTPEVALTVTSIDADLYKGSTKSDLTITASGGNNDMVHVANGFYSLELTAGNVDTLGILKLTFNISGALPFYEDFAVMNQSAWDSKYGATPYPTLTQIEASSVLAKEATLTTIDGIVDTILADTNELQADITNGGRVDLLIDAIKAKTDNLKDAWNDLSAAAVNAEVVDVLHTDTHAEPGQGNPPATTSRGLKIDYMYKFLRNKKENTATETKVYNDAGDTVDHKSTVSDDGTTATQGEFVTGA